MVRCSPYPVAGPRGPLDRAAQIAERKYCRPQARRLLAIAAVLDGASREEAAKIGGMDRQTLRDWDAFEWRNVWPAYE